MRWYKFISAIAVVILTTGCVTTTAGYRAADKLALEHHLKEEYLNTDLCTLTVFHKFNRPGVPITVYIEGDGTAWRSRRELSDDPTPRHPLVLSLAAMDPSDNVAYLARPGQLTASGRPDCDPAYWSGKRFSREVVNAMNSAIDNLKSESRSEEINLIGYSGGAAIAVIIAAQRKDVISLRTIAGNLDHEAVNQYHKVTSLEGSLNPIDFSNKVSAIPQRHFTASGDHIVPIFIARSFVAKEGDEKGESITVVEGTTHFSGWQKAWPSLLKLPLYKNSKPRAIK